MTTKHCDHYHQSSWSVKGQGSGGYWDDTGYHYSYTPPPLDPRCSLQLLMELLAEYDALRLKLEQQGGKLADLERLTGILCRELTIPGRWKTHEVSLIDQDSLRYLLQDVGNYEVHLQVRQLPTRMPAYYLSRTHRDYFCEYSLIVEDLYLSPGYPLTDDRFVKLMQYGHETFFLRLSPFREGADRMLAAGQETPVAAWQVDALLHTLGRQVFQAGWHEDQRLAVAVATHFGLSQFLQAIELLYLCLSGELCELRLAVDAQMLRFFEDIYPQPVIHAFLIRLTRLDGSALNAIPDQALKLYPRLSRAFGRFLGVAVEWGREKVKVPLYKLIYGNLTRLSLVAGALLPQSLLKPEISLLEDEAKSIMLEIQG